MHQGRFRIDISKKFCSVRVVDYWNKLPKEVIESPFLEQFKKCEDVVFRDMVLYAISVVGVKLD